MNTKKYENNIINFARKYTGIRSKEWQTELLRNHKKVTRLAKGRTL